MRLPIQKDSTANGTERTGRATRAVPARCACVAFLAAAFGIPFLFGCDEDAARSAFRGAASDGIETGVRAIVGGVIDGAFAAFDIGADTNAGGGPSGDVGDATSGDSTTADATETATSGSAVR
jgi:hypothetical protein